MTYANLVDLVKSNQGKLILDVTTIEVGRETKKRFAGIGHGFTWTKKMRGSYNGTLAVELETTATGRTSQKNLLGLPFGFVWAKEMHGHLDELEFDLTATKVVKKRRKGLLAAGYGYAWAEQMSGEIGPHLRLRFTTTEVSREPQSRFAANSSGLAWSNKAELVITLN
ncbi:MAG: hypothetical protein ABIA75_08665 [Candidatus Neomarinimicrobiota bacterium]